MANFNFTVDTDPMANEISSVSRHVDIVSGSVVAMQHAVIKAEEEGAEKVCQNVNYGFYSLMQSQISQKIAALTSKVEAILIDMGQQASALSNIKNRMERDYNMISNRYGKLFNTLNRALYTRIFEIDKSVMTLANKDMVIAENRIKALLGTISTNQEESILTSQLIMVSKTKSDSVKAIDAINKYISSVHAQSAQSEAVITNVKVDGVANIYIPIVISESNSESGLMSSSFNAPISNIEKIDDIIKSAASRESVNAINNGNWQQFSKRDKSDLDREFSTILLVSSIEERVKSHILAMYNANSNIKQLKESR